MDVYTPRSLDEALRLRAELPDALAIQGGTDLMVDLNFDRRRPEALLNLNEVAELKGWSRENGSAGLGAGLTQRSDERRSSRRSCPRSREARAPSARRRSGTAARSAAISARPRPWLTRCRRS
jgi:CO/xanthine dehydrogenase FAD-binding subunit